MVRASLKACSADGQQTWKMWRSAVCINAKCRLPGTHSPRLGVFRKLNMKCKVQVNQLRRKISYSVFLETWRGVVFLPVTFSKCSTLQQCGNVNWREGEARRGLASLLLFPLRLHSLENDCCNLLQNPSCWTGTFVREAQAENEEETPGVILLLEIFRESLWPYVSNETCW